MTFKIEIGKDEEYTTREGNPVRIHAVDMPVPYPILATVKGANGWRVVTTDRNGNIINRNNPHADDIVERGKTYWINVYRDSISGGFRSRESADATAVIEASVKGERIGCICIYCRFEDFRQPGAFQILLRTSEGTAHEAK